MTSQSMRQDLGGWRRDLLWNAAAGYLPLDQALHLVGAGPTTEIHTRAHADLTGAHQAYTGGDAHTAEALISDLAVTIRTARTGRKG